MSLIYHSCIEIVKYEAWRWTKSAFWVITEFWGDFSLFSVFRNKKVWDVCLHLHVFKCSAILFFLFLRNGTKTIRRQYFILAYPERYKEICVCTFLDFKCHLQKGHLLHDVILYSYTRLCIWNSDIEFHILHQ